MTWTYRISLPELWVCINWSGVFIITVKSLVNDHLPGQKGGYLKEHCHNILSSVQKTKKALH